MLRFYAGAFMTCFITLAGIEDEIRKTCEIGRGDEDLDGRTADRLGDFITDVAEQCGAIRFQRGLDRCSGLRFSLDHGLLTFNRTQWELNELQEAINGELYSRLFLTIDKEDATYFNKKQPFGEAVYTKFESARHDVREACNCFALGRYTATVFHSMRVLEKGLHALVHDLNNNHNAGIVFNSKVEDSNWGNIITEIQIALENPKRTKRLDPMPDKDRMRFFSRASLEFEYFKNAWRDDVSHSRSSYDRPGAESVMNHVQAFMRIVAEHLQE